MGTTSNLCSSSVMFTNQLDERNGILPPFDVLLRERDLVEAESQKIGALELYRNSLTSLHRAQGTILDVRSINVSNVEPLR